MLTTEGIQSVAVSPDRSGKPNGDEKRVLAVVRWPLGGIRTHILYTYPALIDAGYRFTFIGPDGDLFYRFADSVNSFPGCEFVAVPTRGARCPLWKWVGRLAQDKRFGLIHSHGMTAACNSVAGNLWQGLPHLVTIHGVFSPDEFAGPSGWMKQKVLTHALRRTSSIVGVSQDVCDHLVESLPGIDVSSERLLAISNRIDIDKTSSCGPQPGFLRERLELTPATLLLGFLGRFVAEKGFGIVLQALDEFKAFPPDRPIHLVAIGSGDCRKQYEREVQDRGLGGMVTFLDYTPNVIPYLRQLDLLVVPSLLEASSLVSMEAMAVGVPVLGSNCIGLREVLRDTPSRMFQSGNARSLAEAIRSASSSLWTASAVAFVPEARQRFDSRRSGREFLMVFERLYRQRITTFRK